MLDQFTPDQLLHALKMCRPITDRLHKDEQPTMISSDRGQGSEHADNMKHQMHKKLHQIRPLLRRIFPNNSSQVNISDLVDIAHFLPMAPTYIFKRVDMEDLAEKWPKLQEKGMFSLPALKTIKSRLKPRFPKTPRNYTADSLKQMGQLLLASSCEEIEHIHKKALMQFVKSNYFINNEFPCEENEEICRTIASRVVKEADNETKPVMVKLLGKLGRFLSHEDLKGDDELCSPYFSESVAKEMVRRQKRRESDEGDDAVDEFGENPKERKSREMVSALKNISPNGRPEKDFITGALGKVKKELGKELSNVLKERFGMILNQTREGIRNMTNVNSGDMPPGGPNAPGPNKPGNNGNGSQGGNRSNSGPPGGNSGQQGGNSGKGGPEGGSSGQQGGNPKPGRPAERKRREASRENFNMSGLELDGFNFTTDNSFSELNLTEVLTDLRDGMLDPNNFDRYFGDIDELIESGELELDSSLYDLSEDTSCEGLNLLSMGDEMFEEVPQNGKGLEFLQSFQKGMKRKSSMEGEPVDVEKLDKGFNLIKDTYGFGQRKKNICIDDGIAENLACFFTRSGKSDLKRLSPDTRKNILMAESKSVSCLETMPRSQIKDHLAELIEVDDELNTTRQWSADLISKKGPGLFCGLTEELVDRLSPEAAAKFGGHLCRCRQLDPATRRTIFGKIKEHHGNNLNNLLKPPYNKGIASCFMYASPEEIKQLSAKEKKIFAAMSDTVLRSVMDRIEQVEEDDHSFEEVVEEKAKAKELARTVWTLMDGLGLTKVDKLSLFPHFKSVISPEFIRGLTNQEFSEAIDFLQDEEEWTETQESSLATQIDEVFGAVSEWNASNILQLGGLASMRLRNESNSIVTSIDECTLQTLLKHGPNDGEGMIFQGLCRRLDQTNTFKMIARHPQAICCLNETDAMQLEADDFLVIFKRFEKCHPCLKRKPNFLNAVGKSVGHLIREQYTVNDIVDPPQEILDGLKCLAGSLPETLLRNLSMNTLTQLDHEVIRNMNAEHFCEIVNEEFVSHLSTATFHALDDEKLMCLSDDLTTALIEATDGSVSEEGEMENNVEPPDFTVTDIGSVDTFTQLETDVNTRPMQSGTGSESIVCVSPNDANEGHFQRERLVIEIQGDELTLFNRMENASEFEFSSRSNLDVSKILREVSETFRELRVPQSFPEFTRNLPKLIQSRNERDMEMLENIFSTLHPKAYTLIRSAEWCKAVKKMKKRHLDAFCGRLTKDDVSGKIFYYINSACPVCVTYWVANAAKREFYNILNEEKATTFYSLVTRQRRFQPLSIAHIGPEGVTPNVLNKVQADDFRKTRSLISLSHPKVLRNFPENSLRVLMKKIIKKLGAFMRWPTVLKSRYQYLMFHMPRRDIKRQLSPSQMIDILMSREERLEVLDNKAIRNMLGREINSYILKRKNSLPQEILRSPQVFCLQLSVGLPKKLLRTRTSPYDSNFLVSMAQTCRDFYDIPLYASRKFLREILKTRRPDESLLSSLADVIDLVSPKDLRKFQTQAWIAVWPEVKNSSLKIRQLRVIWNALRSEYMAADVTPEKFEELGRLILVFPRSFMKAIPDPALLSSLTDIAHILADDVEKGLPRPFKRSLWSKINNILRTQKRNVSEFLATDFPSELASIVPKSVYDRLEWDLRNASVREKAFSLAEYVGNKGLVMAGVFSNLDLNNTEDQEGVVESTEVADILLMYGNSNALGNIADGQSKRQLLEDMARRADTLSPRTLERVYEIIKRQINLREDCRAESICLEESEAHMFGPLFAAARPSDFRCLTQETRQFVLKSIGRHERLCRNMAIPVIRQLLNLIYSAMSFEGEEDLEIQYGCLICGFSNENMRALSDEQVSQLQDTLSRCPHFTNDIRQIIVEKIIRNSGGLSAYIEANPDLGIRTMIAQTNPADIRNLNEEGQEILTAVLGDITSGLNENARDIEFRRERNEISDEEVALDENDINEVLSAVYDVVTRPASARRRKRSTEVDEEQCDILEDFNQNLCFLTLSQVNSLSDSSVQLCADQFQACDYNDEIMSSLAGKAANVLGNATQWEDTDYESLGKLLGHMDTEIINDMVLTDDNLMLFADDVMHNGDKLMKQYMATTNKNLSTLTGSDIADYSMLLGSFTPDELNALEPTAISEAVITHNLAENSLENLPSETISLFTNKLIESNELNFTAASSDDISNLGALAGALPENVLSSLDSDQKSGITAQAMSLIEPDVLASSFSVDDFGSLSSDQANALSENQRSLLSPEQNSVVVEKATTVSGDDDGRGTGAAVSPNVLVMLMLLLAALWGMKTIL